MWLFDYFYKALNWIGLANKDATMLFLGLDNAGKTTLLHMLRDNKVEVHEPTRHAQSEDLVIGSVKFTTYDLGGHAAGIWKDYTVKIDAIVFLIDVANPSRFKEAKEELNALLTAHDIR